MTISAPSTRRGRPRGSDDEKLLAIARQTFITDGFRKTTMEAVASKAHISKQSLYRMYPSKDALYAAVVRDWIERGHNAMRPHITELSRADDVSAGLLRLAGILQAGLLSPPVLQMRTLIAAEATRFPEVAADYVTQSWVYNLGMLAKALDVLVDRELLHIEDTDLAAEQLTWLVVAAPLNRLTLQPDSHPYPEEELRTLAAEGVQTFLSRYLPPGR